MLWYTILVEVLCTMVPEIASSHEILFVFLMDCKMMSLTFNRKIIIWVIIKGRFTDSFNNDWKFLKLPQKDGLSELEAEKPDFNDSNWESVTLPHTWNAVDGCDGWSGIDEGGEHYYRGIGGYRKSYFFDSDRFADKEIFLEFEGANTVTELYVNGASAGIHEGGYSAFRFDITEYVKLDEENIIAVKVSNAPTDYIAPITNQGDFTKMGGIYRDVTLISVSKTHIDLMDYGSSGIYITPKNITADTAAVDILVKLANNGQTEENITVKAEVYDMKSGIAAQAESNAVIPAGINTDADKVELFINGVSVGAVERSSLDPLYSTVFTWDNISINQDEENQIKAAAVFSDGKTLEDTAVWTGIYVEPEPVEENIALGKSIVLSASASSRRRP